MCPRRAAASWCACSARSCARRRTTSARWSRWRPGKIVSEGLGEVQEMIDICDLGVGLSRQLFGLTIASERPGHRMLETWHPLGPVAVITAFNFPVAVWSWNTALALVCGDSVIWKPSPRTPLTALACQALLRRAGERLGGIPDGLLEVDRRRERGARSSSRTTGACRSCRPPARPRWAARSRPGSRRGSAAACSSWAATTR